MDPQIILDVPCGLGPIFFLHQRVGSSQERLGGSLKLVVVEEVKGGREDRDRNEGTDEEPHVEVPADTPVPVCFWIGGDVSVAAGATGLLFRRRGGVSRRLAGDDGLQCGLGAFRFTFGFAGHGGKCEV